MGTRIDLDISDGLATVTLHNPAKLNAVNAAMWRGLSAAMAQIAGDDSVRCVIVRGAGDDAFAAQALLGPGGSGVAGARQSGGTQTVQPGRLRL